MQLTTYVEARLGRWSRWYRWGSDPTPRRTVSWYHKIVTEPNVEQIGRPDTACPVDIDEAEDTHKAVMALEPQLRDTVFEAYLRGGTVEQKCRVLGLRSRQSYYNRLASAYQELLGYLNDQAAGVPLPAAKPRPGTLENIRRFA